MQRPPSISRFERLYLLALGTSVLGWWLAWGAMQRQLAANPSLDGLGWLVPFSALVWIAVWLALAYWVARGGSAVPKWIVIGFAAMGVLRVLINLPALLDGQVPAIIAVQWVITLALVLAATAALFRLDARVWLGEDAAAEPLA